MPFVKIMKKSDDWVRPKDPCPKYCCLFRLKIQQRINDLIFRVYNGESTCLDKIKFALLFIGICIFIILQLFLFATIIMGVILTIGWNLGRDVVPFPTELFWWPQPTYLGGSGYPPPSPLHIAQLNTQCPLHRPKFDLNNIENNDLNHDYSIRTSPRWVIEDRPCLNISHLDAGVCISGSGSNSMKCLPSFLVIGAQKAGSTDLRGLLSFHPFLDGPSSEVRFFAHVNEYDLNHKWRQYLDWFPEWGLPSHDEVIASGKLHDELKGLVVQATGMDKPSSQVDLFTSYHGSGGSTGAQWTYEKSPAYLGNTQAPPLVAMMLPSVKILAILREPGSRAYSAFQHNCRFKRWRLLDPAVLQDEKNLIKEQGGGNHLLRHRLATTEKKFGNKTWAYHGKDTSSLVERKLSHKIKEETGEEFEQVDEDEGLIINCDVSHDIKFDKVNEKGKDNEVGSEVKKADMKRCNEAKLLDYPCQPYDFELLLKQHKFEKVLDSYEKDVQRFEGLAKKKASKKQFEWKTNELEKTRDLYKINRNNKDLYKFLSTPLNDPVYYYMEKLHNLKGEAGSLVSKGLYSFHLRDWLQQFDARQLKVILFEDFYKSGVDASIKDVTDFLGIPHFNIEEPKGHAVYTWYNAAQRDRNKYDSMTEDSRNFLNKLFCEANKDLAKLLNLLGTKLETRHKYSCV